MSVTAALFVCVPLLMFVLAWFFNRRWMHRTLEALDRCECTAINRRAEKMHAAVDAKIRAMDSRSGDDSIYAAPRKTDPPTEVNPALPDNPTKAPAIVFVLVLLLG